MREILFKAKIKDSNEWVIGYYVYVDYLDKHYILVSEKTHDGFSGMLEMKQYEVDGDTICQCTGLKDKNGKFIWENDIARYCDCTVENYVIAWEQDKACFEYQQYGCSIMNFDELSGMEVEIIGNIFDNTELMNE